MYNKLRGIKNIMLVLLVLKVDTEIAGSDIQIVNDYNEFLNIQDSKLQQKIFKGIVTHCDFDESPENEKKEELLDILKNNGY